MTRNELNKGRELMSELRLHLDSIMNIEPVKKENSPEIALALQHHREINATHNEWATLEITQFEHHRVVKLDVGTVHPNGMHEVAMFTRYYLIVNGRANFTTSVHS